MERRGEEEGRGGGEVEETYLILEHPLQWSFV